MGYNLNLPLPRGTDWAGYQPALELAIERVSDYGADALVFSFGADSYLDDPLGSFRLERDDFTRIGQAINSLGLRSMIVLEGGYATEVLGSNVCALLDGIS